MAKCIIFCAGEFDKLAEPICADDFIIAADGGLKHCETLGIDPDLVLGDFDSLGHIPENATVFPVEKDDTDAMLAVREGLKRGYQRFLFYGGLEGPRLDHTVANLQTLNYLAEHGAQGCLMGKTQIATAIKNSALRFPAAKEGVVSVFCIGAEAKGVTIKGLKYPMEAGCLTAAFPLGVSNHFIGQGAEISVTHGTLLIIFPRSAPFPPYTL